jgi:dolichyl-diphosphooligosaccharide--protein glycosyltransferase
MFLFIRFGFISATPGKFLNVLNPFRRLEIPLVESVAEHRPGAWGAFYFEYGIGIFLIPVSIYFTVKNTSNQNIFLTIFTLTTAYFASSMIRLTLIMAPAFSLLWAIAIVRLLKSFISTMKAPSTISKQKTRFRTQVGKEFSVIFIIMMFSLLAFTFVIPRRGEASKPINSAYTQTTIAAGALPIRPDVKVTDWIEALVWMRDNLPQNAVVASWWDYGYWITVLGNQTTLSDNGTSNMTQIGTVGLMFMSIEDEAIDILKKYDVTHVVVFTSFEINSGSEMGWGDDGKWKWMLEIAASVFPNIDLKESNYGEYTTDPQTGYSRWEWNTNGRNSTIYKLITYGKHLRLYGSSSIPLNHFNLVYVSHGPIIYGSYLAPVCIYEINY